MLQILNGALPIPPIAGETGQSIEFLADKMFQQTIPKCGRQEIHGHAAGKTIPEVFLNGGVLFPSPPFPLPKCWIFFCV